MWKWGRRFINFEKQSVGVDICPELIDICKKQNLTVFCNDILSYEDEKKYDYVMCVAVIHHIDTEEKRMKLLYKIKELMKENGKALITTWTKKSYNRGDNDIPFNGNSRYYYIMHKDELIGMCRKVFEDKIFNYFNEKGNDCVIVE